MKDEIINKGCQFALKQLFIQWLAEFIEFSKANEFIPQNHGKTM